ncbi:hypothetical protein LY28_00038 [Ruminiclostridium sufflavum DSM 19573]|uniref:Uncharacterized protein n=1 Tax=Ruminiclostridium sufflavum DSM 19573 TaxID=1121337 RepID=A0A318Y3L1_9FIRM|nr:hypothetical protein [Ruminiclostridium sufflavum]PYG90158.1 hypothetical protein LY28_00038 [Ruminiclostridium sufflavum DSM 19573]
MKISIEFNATELKDAIISGTLLHLVESVKTADSEARQAVETINGAVPAQQTQAMAQPQQQLNNAAAQPQQQIYNSPIQQPQQMPQQQAYQQQQPVTNQQATPVQFPVQQQPVQGAIPITAPVYTLEQLSVAGTQLVDSGRMAELQQLLSSFGVSSLMQLPKEQYGTFATQLRAMGAKI